MQSTPNRAILGLSASAAGRAAATSRADWFCAVGDAAAARRADHRDARLATHQRDRPADSLTPVDLPPMPKMVRAMPPAGRWCWAPAPKQGKDANLQALFVVVSAQRDVTDRTWWILFVPREQVTSPQCQRIEVTAHAGTSPTSSLMTCRARRCAAASPRPHLRPQIVGAFTDPAGGGGQQTVYWAAAMVLLDPAWMPPTTACGRWHRARPAGHLCADRAVHAVQPAHTGGAGRRYALSHWVIAVAALVGRRPMLRILVRRHRWSARCRWCRRYAGTVILTVVFADHPVNGAGPPGSRQNRAEPRRGIPRTALLRYLILLHRRRFFRCRGASAFDHRAMPVHHGVHHMLQAQANSVAWPADRRGG